MFRRANELARKYTRPVITSQKTMSGVCASAIGAFVAVNEEGWIVTANHVIEHWAKLSREIDNVRRVQEQIAEVEADKSLNPKQRNRKKSKLQKGLERDPIERCSAYWSLEGVTLKDIATIPAADVAIGRLEPFDPASFSAYAVFKKPNEDFLPGASLCKLGFPFHSVTPTWDAANEMFRLPDDALPLPMFPLEGIFTRTARIEVEAGDEPPFRLLWVETSSPGLKGQSGGPIFDVDGVVWAIQCRTRHLPLGFDPLVPGTNRREHQFLNVGVGVHPETIFGLLDSRGVTYQVSD